MPELEPKRERKHDGNIGLISAVFNVNPDVVGEGAEEDLLHAAYIEQNRRLVGSEAAQNLLTYALRSLDTSHNTSPE